MAHYLVVWEIDIDADSPEEAAREARAIQLDKESKATVFVLHSDNGTDTIDTSDEEIENTPCEKCGSTENLLHFNRECTDCFDPSQHPND